MGSYPVDDSLLTATQDKILSLAPLFTGTLSIVGSGHIIYMVLSAEKRTPYRRILLGLSCCDVFGSIHQILQPYLMPSGTAVWAMGNEATCTALGFFQQLATSDMWYNSCLSFYFMLTVRFSIHDQQMARTYEPWMHILSIGWPLTTASLGAAFGVYDAVDIGHGCWVANYPRGCDCTGGKEGECCLSPLIAWVVAGIPSLVFMMMILVNNLVVFCHVRSTIKRSMAYVKEYTNTLVRSSARSVDTNNKQEEQNRLHEDPQVKRIRAVATQSFLYVAAYFITGIWFFLLKIIEGHSAAGKDSHQGKNYFPLMLTNAILKPMSGFFTCFIFCRPAYMRARTSFPDESRLWAFRRALHGKRIEPRQSTLRSSTRPRGFSSKENTMNRTGGVTTKNDYNEDDHNNELATNRPGIVAEPAVVASKTTISAMADWGSSDRESEDSFAHDEPMKNSSRRRRGSSGSSSNPIPG